MIPKPRPGAGVSVSGLSFPGAGMDGQTNTVPARRGQWVRQGRRATFHQLVTDRPAVLRVLAGRKRIRWDGGLVDAGPGDLVLMAEGMPLTVENLPPAGGSYLAQALPFERTLADRVAQRLCLVPGDRPCASVRTQGPMETAFAEAFDADAGLPDAIIDLRIEELLIWLAGAGATLPAAQPVTLVARLRRMIVAAPGDAWTADRAASILAMSAPTLRRRLAAEGQGFQALLAETRMSLALGLLQTTDLPVGLVAAAVGYDSPSRFAARFRARFATTPRDIRALPRAD